jgi:hypothetical protein
MTRLAKPSLIFAAMLALTSLSACSKCSVPTFGFVQVCNDKPLR